MSLELKKAIEQISKDKGLDRDMLVSTLEEAVRTSVIRKYGDDLDVEVHYSDDTGDIEVFQFKFVVEEVENPLTQISLEDARQHDASIQLDDEMVTNRRISFEYALISGVNDSEQNAHQLGKVLSGMLCHVNLIPVNEVKERGYKKSTREQVARFTEILNSYKINTTVRRKLGGDINASCGQLRAEHREE